jgi:ribonuclease HI
MKKNRLYLFTDASYCQQTRAGGYAFIAKCDSFEVRFGTHFKNDCNGCFQAEMMSIINCLTYIKKHVTVSKAESIILYTDSEQAILHISNNSSHLGVMASRLIQDVKKEVGASKFTLKHISAHTGDKGRNARYNQWCDITAKKYMKYKKSLSL